MGYHQKELFNRSHNKQLEHQITNPEMKICSKVVSNKPEKAINEGM